MGIESNKGAYPMTSEEKARQKLAENEKALESLKKTLGRELTPEEVEENQRAAKEREETRPWGI